MRKDISEYIQDCHPCKEHASKFNMDPTWHSIPVTPTWHTNGIDIAGPFPTSEQEHSHVIVAIDYSSKWVEAGPVRYATADEASAFLKTAMLHYRAVSTVTTDQG